MMKIGSFILLAFFFCMMINTASASKLTLDQWVERIHWFGQAAIRIDAPDAVIYLDPYKLSNPSQADMIFITHSHQDHFSLDDIAKIVKEQTVFVASEDAAEIITAKYKSNRVIPVKPGVKTEIGAIQIEAVPAYNVVKTQFHPRENNWVGYILNIDGTIIYHTGDTERIPEMASITCDILLSPLGQTYTMNSVAQAAEVALDVKAKIAIPIHYGMYEGTKEDAIEYYRLLKDKVRVVLKRHIQ